MLNKQKKNRTLIEDLPVAEQELTSQEMENVQGGKKYFESRSNTAKSDTPPLTPPPTPTSPLLPPPTTTGKP